MRASEAREISSGKRRPDLVRRRTDDLRQAIPNGDLKRGRKRPGEAGPTEKHSVNRTVACEAVAALRADGQAAPQRGAGVFVAGPDIAGLTLPARTNHKISDIIEELELRAPVEIVATKLAATRCSPAREADIQAQRMLFARTIESGLRATEADFEFHLEIARAANHARFAAFPAHWGRRTIPRSQRAEEEGLNELKSAGDLHLHQEYVAVAEAVSDRAPGRARDAMRARLAGSLQRYRALTGQKNTNA